MQFVTNIGQGGFGVVEKVIDTDGKQYAKKSFHILYPDVLDDETKQVVLARFRREVKEQEGITHRNVVRVLQSDINASPPYYIMPLAESSLHDDLIRDKSLNGHFLEAILDILAGLAEIHALGMAHRDLKPRNILRFSDDQGSYYAIGDFGFVSAKDSQVSAITRTGMGLQGDTFYSPEIAVSIKDAWEATDIYSLGCIIHSMVGSSSRVPTLEIKDSGPFGHIMAICTRPDPYRRPNVASLREAILSVGTEDALSAFISQSELAQALASQDIISHPLWVRISDFLTAHPALSGNSFTDETRTLLRLLTYDRINEVHALDVKLFEKIGTVFAIWARQSSFPFEFCDALSDRLERLIALGDIALKTECIMALLYLGTAHNRYYVERAFLRNTGIKMDERLAQRIAIEFSIDADVACRAIALLEGSLNWRRTQLHPKLITTLSQICK